MSEFTKGIFNLLKDSSLSLAIIYTLGHIMISASVVTIVTGASLFEAGLVALIEPTINGIWFYILHKLWTFYNDRV
tara:strand:+ start:750 stop:977 length:228 start_codon:yes stop_codon:yes gene_type:complete